MNFYEQAAEFIKKYEGYSAKAMWDVNAWRLGHGSDTITFPDGNYRKVLKTDVTTRDMAAKDLARRIKQDFEPRVIKQIGESYYNKIPHNARISLISFAYNYGSIVKPSIIEAAKTGDANKIGETIYNSTANDNKGKPYYNGLRKRRKAEWDFAIKPSDLDKSFPFGNLSSGAIKPTNLFIFTIIAGVSIYFLIKQI